MDNKALKFLKNKQKAYFKEYEVYATDDILISEWIEEYHQNCVMENTLNDSLLGMVNEDEMLKKLWLDIIHKKLDGASNSFDVTSFANEIIMSYRSMFVDYIPPMRYDDEAPMRYDGEAPMPVYIPIPAYAEQQVGYHEDEGDNIT